MKILNVEDIKSGKLPGKFFPKLLEMGEVIIRPFDTDSLGNICYYLHFNNLFRRPVNDDVAINLLSKDSINSAFHPYEEMDKYVLMPGKSVICQTYEQLGLSEWFLAKLENTSSFGRVFLNQASHGYMHPGHGIKKPFRIMVELTNLGEKPIEILPAKIIDGKIVGPQCMRLYIEKLNYKAEEYKSTSIVPKLKMNRKDGS